MGRWLLVIVRQTEATEYSTEEPGFIFIISWFLDLLDFSFELFLITMAAANYKRCHFLPKSLAFRLYLSILVWNFILLLFLVAFLNIFDFLLDILRHHLFVLILLLEILIIFVMVIVLKRLFLVTPTCKNLAGLDLDDRLSLITPNGDNFTWLDSGRLVLIVEILRIFYSFFLLVSLIRLVIVVVKVIDVTAIELALIVLDVAREIRTQVQMLRRFTHRHTLIEVPINSVILGDRRHLLSLVFILHKYIFLCKRLLVSLKDISILWVILGLLSRLAVKAFRQLPHINCFVACQIGNLVFNWRLLKLKIRRS